MTAQEDFVLDCSATMAWCFDDEATAYTDGGRGCLAEKRAIVPSIWPLGAANATLMGGRRSRAKRPISSGLVVASSEESRGDSADA